MYFTCCSVVPDKCLPCSRKNNNYKLKDAITRMITFMNDYFKEMEDGLPITNPSEEYKMKFCVVCERCQIKANNDEHVKESSGT